MKVKTIPFSDLYRGLQVMQLNQLESLCVKGKGVHEKDQFALTTGIVEEATGEFVFEILAVGETEEKCTKGLTDEESLGTITYEFVQEAEAKKIMDDSDLVFEKKQKIFQKEGASFDQVCARRISVLDSIRNPQYPDYFTGVFVNEGTWELPIRALAFNQNKMTAELLVDRAEEFGIRPGAPVYLIAVQTLDSIELIDATTLVSGKVSDAETISEMVDDLVEKIMRIEIEDEEKME